MQNFLVSIVLKIVTISDSDSSKFLVLLDDNGDFPKFYLSSDMEINEQISKHLQELLYENDMFLVLSTKQFSTIDIKENEIEITFQFMSSSTYSKKGAYTVFEKRSIELYKLAKNINL